MSETIIREALEDMEVFLDERTKVPDLASSPVWQAARYSLLAGGKRIRPQLLLRASLVFARDLHPAAPALAGALEMVHTYSLIHDDLPAMDDDDFRRGRPSCHRVYGDATAILAGDLLLNEAYELGLDSYSFHGDPAILEALKVLAGAAGGRGMILGQDRDLLLESKSFNQVKGEEVVAMAGLKTGRLIRAGLLMGGWLGGAPKEASDLLSRLGDAFGLAFQMTDDILDCVASRDKLGKTPNKDREAGKKTFVTLYGLDGARRLLEEERAKIKAAQDLLGDMGFNLAPLTGYLEDLMERKH